MFMLSISTEMLHKVSATRTQTSFLFYFCLPDFDKIRNTVDQTLIMTQSSQVHKHKNKQVDFFTYAYTFCHQMAYSV